MTNWQRVTRAFPCEICSRPDWCCVGDKYFLCMRVASDKPCKSGGWFHAIESKNRPAYVPPPRVEKPKIDAQRMIMDWMVGTSHQRRIEFAHRLGVTPDSLAEIGAAWAPEYDAWAFPMLDGFEKVVGVRLRSECGRKWAVYGSRQGVFIPWCRRAPRVYLPEGPTDTAAALSLGLFAIGRPSCQCGAMELRQALRRFGVREVVVVSDNDDPGLNGARRLAGELPFRSCVYLPPAKDLRQAVGLGLTRQMIESTINGMIWNQPKEL